MKKKRTARVILLVLIAATTAFIWGQSLKNSADSQQTSGFIRQLLVSLFGQWIEDTFFFEYLRKFAHFAEFAVLGVEWCALALLQGAGLRNRWWLPVAGPLTAACDELLQLTSPGRSAAVSDVLLDSAGYACGAVAVWLIALLWRRHRARTNARRG